jgi:hypothetical protein
MQQSYKISDSFPYKWINKKWREGFYVTAMATSGSRWGVVMSRGAGFAKQVIFILIFIKIYCIPYSVLIYFSMGWRSNSMY